MEVTHHRIDLTAEQNLGRKEFHDVIARNERETWVVPFGPIQVDAAVDWRYYKREKHVVIPLIPYLVHPDPALAMGFMLQLGVRCAFDFGRPVKRMHLATGNPVNQIIDQASGDVFWQYYVGLAVILQP